MKGVIGMFERKPKTPMLPRRNDSIRTALKTALGGSRKFRIQANTKYQVPSKMKPDKSAFSKKFHDRRSS